MFGLAKELSAPLEWHIRGFRDGRIESEIEVSRRYIGHQSTPARPFHGPLIKILRKHGVQFEFIETPPPDPEEMSVSSTLIDWLPLAAFFFGPVLRLCGAFKEETKKTESGNVEKRFQINFRRLTFATVILSVPLRIVCTILLMISTGARLKIFLRLRRLASIRPPQLAFIYSISTLRKEEEQKMLFQKFFDNLKLEKLAELQLSTSFLEVNVEN